MKYYHIQHCWREGKWKQCDTIPLIFGKGNVDKEEQVCRETRTLIYYW